MIAAGPPSRSLLSFSIPNFYFSARCSAQVPEALISERQALIPVPKCAAMCGYVRVNAVSHARRHFLVFFAFRLVAIAAP
jgi:hypothetical protein